MSLCVGAGLGVKGSLYWVHTRTQLILPNS